MDWRYKNKVTFVEKHQDRAKVGTKKLNDYLQTNIFVLN